MLKISQRNLFRNIIHHAITMADGPYTNRGRSEEIWRVLLSYGFQRSTASAVIIEETDVKSVSSHSEKSLSAVIVEETDAKSVSSHSAKS